MARLALAALLSVLACEETRAFEAELSWRFADGRPCDLAGAQTLVVLEAGEELARAHCEDGLSPSGAVRVPVAGLGSEVVLEARSVTGALLYRGEARLAPAEGPRTVTLRFVGGG